MDRITEVLVITLGRGLEKRTQLLSVQHEQGCREDKGRAAVGCLAKEHQRECCLEGSFSSGFKGGKENVYVDAAFK